MTEHARQVDLRPWSSPRSAAMSVHFWEGNLRGSQHCWGKLRVHLKGWASCSRRRSQSTCRDTLHVRRRITRRDT